MGLTTSVVSGAIGGLFATVAANFLWRIYTRPHLHLFGSTITKYAYSPNGEIDGVAHKGSVWNHGRSAATNCKINLFLFGGGNGCTYQIDYSTVWSENNYPSRLTVNRGESVSFELLKVKETSEGQVVQFPSESGWESPAAIQKWNEEFKYGLPEGKPLAREENNPELLEELDIEMVANIDWLDGSIDLYSENAKKKSRHVSISVEDEDLDTSLPGSVSRHGIKQHSSNFSRSFRYLSGYLRIY